MQRHTDTYASHRELCHTGLQELTAEVTFLQCMGLLQEAVRLIGVAQVCRADNHITDVLCQETQHLTAGVTRCIAGFLLNQTPVDTRNFTRHEGLVLVRCKRVLFFPFVISRIFLIGDLTQLNSAVLIQFGYLREDNERVLRITTEVLDRLLERSTGLAKRGTVRRALAFPVSTFCRNTTFTHDGMTNNERWTLFLGFRANNSLTNCIRIVTRDLLYVPAPCFVFGCHIFGGHFATLCGELNRVGVVEHNQVIQS